MKQGTLVHWTNVKRDMHICQKRHVYMSKETCIYVKRHWTKGCCMSAYTYMLLVYCCANIYIYVSKETCIYVNRDLYLCLSKETDLYEPTLPDALDRGLLYIYIKVYITRVGYSYIVVQKRPICVERSLYVCQKRPAYMFVKRDLHV